MYLYLCVWFVIDLGDLCTFENGDAIGGTEEIMGETENADQCYELVRLHEPLANGATYAPDFKHCYAEFNATSVDLALCKNCHTCVFSGRLMNILNNDGSS